MRRVLAFLVLALALFACAVPVAADSPIVISSDKFTNNFPRDLSFQIEAQSDADRITRAELLVQVEGVPSIVRLGGTFTPGTKIRATYDWNLVRDYLPPGVAGQYWWEIHDDAGNQVQSPSQSFHVEDQTHTWKQISNQKLALSWYAGGDNLVVSSTNDWMNFVGVIFAVLCALVAFVCIILAVILRKRPLLVVVCVIIALGACAAPPMVLRYVGETPSVSFGQALFDHGVNSLEYLERDTGVTVDRQIQVYVYGDRDDFFNALEPGANEWTGGRDFPEYGVVLINIAPSDLEWGKRALAHEITHQVIHQKIRSPLSELSLPPLIDEGLAVYYESPGAPDPQRMIPLRRAIRNDTLIPLRSLTQAFAADTNIANLSYAQSYSVVDFIFRHYGRDKMAQLLQAFKQGGYYDDIFVQVFGVDIDGLEAAWRANIGAEPRALPTRSLAVPTPFPTFSLSTEATPTPKR